jgi:hypothetical protein
MGFTISGQPTLFWYLSEPVAHELIVRVVDEGRDEPVDELRLQPPIDAGIHSYRMAERNIVLEVDRPYQWGVEVLSNAQRTTMNAYAGTWIMRAAPSDALHTKLTESEASDHAGILAEEGIWYDALAELSSRIERTPDEKSLRAHRAALLEQVGLTDVAVFDRAAGNVE